MRTLYKCEKCGATFKEKGDAIKCEDRTAAFLPPVGLIYKYDDGIYMVVAKNGWSSHVPDGSCWAARDTDAGDNEDHERCGMSSTLYPSYAVDQSAPAFKRCLEWCKRNKITPLIWNGTAVDDFDKKRETEAELDERMTLDENAFGRE